MPITLSKTFRTIARFASKFNRDNVFIAASANLFTSAGLGIAAVSKFFSCSSAFASAISVPFVTASGKLVKDANGRVIKRQNPALLRIKMDNTHFMTERILRDKYGKKEAEVSRRIYTTPSELRKYEEEEEVNKAELKQVASELGFNEQEIEVLQSSDAFNV